MLPISSKLSKFSWINKSKEKSISEEYFNQLKVKAPGIYSETAGLSGGNQQKLVIARWLAAQCSILLIDEPTRGIDVGAKNEIHTLIDNLSSGGAGILLISSDMPELINLSSRIMVLHEGNHVGQLKRNEFEQDKLMRLMSGV